MKGLSFITKSTTTQMVIALVGGMVFGTVVGEWAGNLKFIGDIFIRLIQMSIVVLVMASVISAIGEMARQKEDNTFGVKMGLNTFKWILFFTVFHKKTARFCDTFPQNRTVFVLIQAIFIS